MIIGNYIEEKLIDNWKFQLDQEDLGEQEEWFSESCDRSDWNVVTVPGAWDYYYDALWGYEGIGWFCAEIPAGSANIKLWQRINFQSVAGHTRVWINGNLAGENIGRYMPFEVDATPYLYYDRPNHVVIRTDNAQRHEWLPGAVRIEWAQYGGILQPVTLLSTNHCYISDVAVNAVPEGASASIVIDVEITNRSEKDFSGRIEISALIGCDCKQSIELACPGNSKIARRLNMKAPAVKLWTIDKPVLYPMEISLVENDLTVHAKHTRFGCRTIEVRENQIYLNNEPLLVKGVNRYDEYAQYGVTVPVDLIQKDLTNIKGIGANLVRLHYPQAPVHLDIADEIGLLVIEEIPLNWWRPKEEEIEIHTQIIKNAEEFLERMIRRDRNHPCIIAWSMLNESDTDTKIGSTTAKKLIHKAHELDATRLVTFADCHYPLRELTREAFAEADFIGYNLYPGLGEEKSKMVHHISEMEEKVRKPMEVMLREAVGFFPDKPIVMTEFGSVSIFGLHGDSRFSEAHHAAYMEIAWQAIRSVPGVQGGILWCWADYYHRRCFIEPGGHIAAEYGPYGVVTVDRVPKQLPYQMLGKLFSE